MKRKTKHILNSILFFSTSFIYFFLAYIGFQKQNIDLSKYDKIESVVIDKGIDIHYGSKGKESKVFFIELENFDEVLGIYRMSRNYDDLLKAVNVGDTVAAYYRGNNDESENVNIDLIQVERKGKVIIAKDEYEKKESSLVYIGLIAGILTVILSYLYFKGKILKNK